MEWWLMLIPAVMVVLIVTVMVRTVISDRPRAIRSYRKVSGTAESSSVGDASAFSYSSHSHGDHCGDGGGGDQSSGGDGGGGGGGD